MRPHEGVSDCMFLLVHSDLRVRWVSSASRLGVLVCDKKWCSVTAAWESLSLTTNSAEKECRYAQRHRYGPPARPLARLVAANCDSFPQAIDIFERYSQTKAANHFGKQKLRTKQKLSHKVFLRTSVIWVWNWPTQTFITFSCE